ncbi:MAG TPA: class I SAM-dependent methyltransferase [Marmoricola sp.]
MTRTLPAAEVFSHALRGEACYLTAEGSTPVRLPVDAWRRLADQSDRRLVALCSGPTLDVGCGPGRLTAELAVSGHITLGIDIVEEAVRQTLGRGASALRRDVFDAVPGEGRWETVLVADGNIGIGGDPAVLLRRLHRLLVPGGQVVLEVTPPGVRAGSDLVRLHCACASSPPFAWAVVGVEQVPELAERTGFRIARHLELGDRRVTVLREAAA